MGDCEGYDCPYTGYPTGPELEGKKLCSIHRTEALLKLRNAEVVKLKEALDCAEYAFKFIVARGCLCAFTEDDDEAHDPMCKVLAAQNALDAIKKKLGD